MASPEHLSPFSAFWANLVLSASGGQTDRPPQVIHLLTTKPEEDSFSSPLKANLYSAVSVHKKVMQNPAAAQAVLVPFPR